MEDREGCEPVTTCFLGNWDLGEKDSELINSGFAFHPVNSLRNERKHEAREVECSADKLGTAG